MSTEQVSITFRPNGPQEDITREPRKFDRGRKTIRPDEVEVSAWDRRRGFVVVHVAGRLVRQNGGELGNRTSISFYAPTPGSPSEHNHPYADHISNGPDWVEAIEMIIDTGFLEVVR